MTGKYRKFSPEFREEAARMVVETSRPIAAAVEAVALGHAGGGGQRGDGAEHGEACFGAEPLVVVAGGDEQLPGDLDTDAGAFQQLEGQVFDDRLDEVVQHFDLVAGFLRRLWRYPVRLERHWEYLRVSPEEYDLLYSHDIADAPAPGRLLLREAYGFPEDIADDQPWPEIVVEVPELRHGFHVASAS